MDKENRTITPKSKDEPLLLLTFIFFIEKEIEL